MDFGFVLEPDVEPSNNRVGKALRPSVIYRKVTCGSRSGRGTEIYTTIYFIYYTT